MKIYLEASALINVNILMSTYNGEAFLREQIDSILNQTLPENIKVRLLVRDDGSTDGTTQILAEYADRGALTWYGGDNKRPARSFWDLLHNCPAADYYAFCDQDDVWLQDKVFRAVDRLERECSAMPLLYCSSVTVVDRELTPIRKMWADKPYTDFAHSLVYSLAPGCTFVFNSSAMMELRKYDMDANYVLIHDWLAHKIVALTGKVVYDSDPTMLYRQHGNNVIGAQNDKGVFGFLRKVKRVLTSSANVRSDSAKSILTVYGDQIDEEKRHLLNLVANYRDDKRLKREFMKSDVFAIEGRFFLKATILFNKV